jgi:hypothetical protein
LGFGPSATGRRGASVGERKSRNAVSAPRSTTAVPPPAMAGISQTRLGRSIARSRWSLGGLGGRVGAVPPSSANPSKTLGLAGNPALAASRGLSSAGELPRAASLAS